MVASLIGPSEAQLKIRGSRFIGRATPVDSEEAARREIEAIRAGHPHATHCCYAYRIGAGDAALERVHDAGEPGGSAGAPILSTIKAKRLTNLAVTVVRYFGGVKLGRGGLARAYREAARAALEAGTIVEREIRREIDFEVPMPLSGEARSLLGRFGGEVRAEDYGPSVRFRAAVGERVAKEFRRQLDDLTRGAARWRD